MYSLERRNEGVGGQPGVFEEVETDFAGLDGKVREGLGKVEEGMGRTLKWTFG